MFGTPDDIQTALERNIELAKGLEETGFHLTIPENKSSSSLVTESTLPSDDNFWRDLYYQQAAISRQLEKKLKEVHG